MLRKIIAIVILAGLISTYGQSVQAYWGIVSGEANSVVATVTIGEWMDTWEADPIEPYEVGDVVFWEGVYYIRIVQAGNSNVEPGSPAGWIFWDEE